MDSEVFKSDIDILRSIVGDQKYLEIKKEFAGSSLYIPKMNKDLNYAPIYADLDAGLSFKQIARKHNYTVVWVQKLYNQYRRMKYPVKKEVQHSLF